MPEDDSYDYALAAGLGGSAGALIVLFFLAFLLFRGRDTKGGAQASPSQKRRWRVPRLFRKKQPSSNVSYSLLNGIEEEEEVGTSMQAMPTNLRAGGVHVPELYVDVEDFLSYQRQR